jgi:ferrous iron transport protein A
MLRTINDLSKGEWGKIDGTSIIPLQLLELGFIPNAKVKLLQISPFNDSLYLDINDSHLVLRRENLNKIFII